MKLDISRDASLVAQIEALGHSKQNVEPGIAAEKLAHEVGWGKKFGRKGIGLRFLPPFGRLHLPFPEVREAAAEAVFVGEHVMLHREMPKLVSDREARAPQSVFGVRQNRPGTPGRVGQKQSFEAVEAVPANFTHVERRRYCVDVNRTGPMSKLRVNSAREQAGRPQVGKVDAIELQRLAPSGLPDFMSRIVCSMMSLSRSESSPRSR